MKTIIALAALAVALATTTSSFAAVKSQQSQPTFNGYTLQEWQAGAPSGDPENSH